MGKAFIQESTLTAIAKAIRGKNGSSDTYLPSEMPQAINDIPSGGQTQYNVLCFTAEQANSTVYIQCHKDLNINLQYSYDNLNWTDWTPTLSGNNDVFSTITLTNIGDKVYIRGHNGTMGVSNRVYSKFIMTGRIAASGNIQSLLTYDADSLSVVKCCYHSMFYGCTALTTAPELPATTIADECYHSMFYGCTALTTAHDLPATTLASNCYNGMFRNCTSLTSAPELPATTLTSYCYYSMFSGCTSLTTAPELPATTLVSNCYYSMFQNCTSLTTAPELPATTLANYCYYSMFSGCTALTTAPELPATTLTSNCYYSMFKGCTHLNYIKVGATSWNTSYTSNWVQNVASTGTFIKPYGVTIATGTSGIPSGWTTYNSQVISYNYSTNYCSINTDLSGVTIYYTTDGTEPTTASQIYSEPFYLELSEYSTPVKSLAVNSLFEFYEKRDIENLFYIELESSGTVKYNGQTNSYQYSTDGNTWTNYSNNSNISVSAGSKIFFKKYSNFGYISSQAGTSYKFTVSSNYKVGGCLSMMSHGECKNGMYPLGSNLDGTGSYLDRGGQYLFYNETHLKDASKLIVNIQGAGTNYNQQMFSGCTSLTTAPELPATTLASNCYNGMFSGCTSLTTAPELPATTLASNCYQYMFQNCTSLTSAPELPATTLTSYCYYSMFSGCTSLTTAPELPATTLVSNCYYSMFSGCTHLNYIKVGATSWNTSYTNIWVINVAATGDFYKPTNTSITTGTSGIPSGWTVHNE